MKVLDLEIDALEPEGSPLASSQVPQYGPIEQVCQKSPPSLVQSAEAVLDSLLTLAHRHHPEGLDK